MPEREAAAGGGQDVTPGIRTIFSGMVRDSIGRARAVDVAETRRLRAFVEQSWSARDGGALPVRARGPAKQPRTEAGKDLLDEAADVSRRMRAEVGAGLRRELRMEVAGALDGGDVVVLAAPGGFGKTATMHQLFRDIGGGVYADMMTSHRLEDGLRRYGAEIAKAPLVYLDELGYQDKDEVVKAVNAFRREGKAVVIGVRPLGYYGYVEGVYREAGFREISFSAFGRDDEKRIVDGFGLDDETGRRFMALAEGDPGCYETLFGRRFIGFDKDVRKLLDDFDALEAGGHTGNTSYCLDTGNIKYFRHEYPAMLGCVKKAVEGVPLDDAEKRMALGSGLVLEREGRVYAPRHVRIIVGRNPASLEYE